MRQRDQEIVEIDEQIESEITKGVIPDPNQQMLELEMGAYGAEDPAVAMGELPPPAPQPQKMPKPNEGEI